MATTVGSHTIATFTSPVNGTTPIDANTVRGNDNVIQTAYNAHDTDPGIHVQSSSLASRPVAGTAGRKWITEDSGVYTLWFDDGTNWHPVSSENIALTVLAGENLVKGDVVKVTGWNNGQDLPEVVKTTSAADTAFAVITATVSSGSMGYATNTGIVQDVNTAAYSVGTILYANGSGGFTSTKPTSGNYQPVAYVLRANASNGVYYVEFSTPRIVERSDNTASTVVLRDASGNFSAGTITANLTGNISGSAPAGSLTGTTLASNVVSSSLTSVGTLTNLTVTNTIVGSVNGNAATATALQTARTINGVSFDGTANITVTAAAGTLSGSTLASGVTASSLTSVGTLTSLTVSGNVDVGAAVTSTTWNRWVGVRAMYPGIVLESTATSGRKFSLGVDATQCYLRDETASATRFAVDASGNLAVDTNVLFVDAVNNCVGIGTTSPNTYGALAVFSAGIGLHANSTSGAAGLNFYEGGSNRFSLRTLNGTAGLSFFDSFNAAERARIPSAGGIIIGTAALATTATDGFLYVPTCAGTPTGTPTTQTGTVPIVVDTTNHKLYFYSGAQWRDAGP